MNLYNLVIYLARPSLIVILGILFGGVVGSLILPHVTKSEQKEVVGWIENVRILPDNILIKAKIDTGADNSSINVTELNEYVRSDERWVRFTVKSTDGASFMLERPVSRYAHIKRKGAPRQKRPVVLLNICLGQIYKKDVEVNLADRKGFHYPMLIGRSFLAGSAIVDSSLKYTGHPHCE